MNALTTALRRIGRKANGRPAVIAHRGASRAAPENTLTALELAAEQGADAVEFDVRLTADGALVVMHDARLGRTVSDMRLVSGVTADEVTSFDAGKWFGTEFRGELVPLAEEALSTLRKRTVPIVEIKDSGELGLRSAAILSDLLKREGLVKEVLVASGYPEVLAAMAEASPKTPRLSVVLRGKTARTGFEDGIAGCLVWWQSFTRSLVAAAREHDVFVAPWLVPNNKILDAAKTGADAIVTDEPAAVLEILEASA